MDTRHTVKRILEENGVFPYVAEEEVTAGRDILCKICERILSSTFGVIELTERNPNVMFEFGFILASQKPVFVLYNKAMAQKIDVHPPADISALERIEYYNQDELCERFSKGLRKYIEEQFPTVRREEEKEKALVEASSKGLDLILDALESSNDVKRLEGTRDLLVLCYHKRVSHDKRVLEVITRSLNDPNEKIRGEFLDILRIILQVEDDTHRKTLAKDLLEKIVRISLQDEKVEVRRRAFDVLRETKDAKIIDPSFEAIRKFGEEEWRLVESEVFDCLRIFYEGDRRITITQKLYDLLDEPNLQDRVRAILEVLRRWSSVR